MTFAGKWLFCFCSCRLAVSSHRQGRNIIIDIQTFPFLGLTCNSISWSMNILANYKHVWTCLQVVQEPCIFTFGTARSLAFVCVLSPLQAFWNRQKWQVGLFCCLSIGLCRGGCSATECLVQASWLLAFLRVAMIGQNLSKLPFPETAEALSIALPVISPLCLNIFLRTSTNSEVKEQPRALSRSSMQEQLTKHSMPTRFKLWPLPVLSNRDGVCSIIKKQNSIWKVHKVICAGSWQLVSSTTWAVSKVVLASCPQM